MDVSENTIAMLAKQNKKPGPKASIYMPTHPDSSGPTLQEDQTRFKNAIQEIRSQAAADDKEIKATIKKLKKLQKDMEFWRHQKYGLAVFADNTDIFTVQLPIEITERTELSESFTLHPLILAKSMQLSSLIFDMNLQEPRMFIADASSITRFPRPELKSMQEIMEEDYEHHQQFYSPQGKSSSSPMFHGHGGSDDHAFEEVDIYLYYVADKLNAFLKTQRLPLILAGEKHRLAQLEPLLEYAHIHEEKLYGNHQHVHPDDLHAKVRDILLETTQKDTHQALDELKSSRKGISGWGAIAKALKRKAVGTLFIPAIRKTNDSVGNGKKSIYLLETAAEDKSFEKWIQATLEQGGEIHPVPPESLRKRQPCALVRF